MKPRLIECFERRNNAIVDEGLTFHQAQPPLAMKEGGKRRGRAPRGTGHNLLLRLLTRKEDALRVLRDPSVPFTSNQAERDGHEKLAAKAAIFDSISRLGLSNKLTIKE